MSPPFGEQYTITHGEYEATIYSLGATLRGFTLRSAPIIWTANEGSVPVGSAGQVLAPWPNRLEDGRYIFDGLSGVVPLDEPLRNNAIHGLVRWLFWEEEYAERDCVKLRCLLAPQPAYPFPISLSVTYALGEHGLTVRAEASSQGLRPAPFGIGFHPYFLGGNGGLNDARLVVPATQHYVLDERGLPVAKSEIEERLVSLTSEPGLALSGIRLDDCFSGLIRPASGLAVLRFFPGEGPIAEVMLRLGAEFDYVMCYTGDTLSSADQRRAIAIEPMTCAPNAFVTGDGLQELRAEEFIAEFTVEARSSAT